jgi:GT2 family glycosyltransferase
MLIILSIWMMILVVFVVIVGVIIYYNYSVEETMGSEAGETIFVSIASYRDMDCPITVEEAFKLARNPDRVYLGVCQQNLDDDVDALSRVASKYYKNIKIKRLRADEAKGPAYARAKAEELYGGQDYYMIIDSHTAFTKDWDKNCIDDLRKCDTRKAVLTMYPSDFTEMNKSNMPTYLTFKEWDDHGFPRVSGPKYLEKADKPRIAKFWAAGYSFAPGSMIRDVPYDPYLPYVFFGEEYDMGARLFTHGYDLYHPTKMHVYHKWNEKRPTFWEQKPGEKEEVEKKSYARLRSKFKLEPKNENMGKYDIGTERTLREYELFTGLCLDVKGECPKEEMEEYNKS